jgi:hypothetical protein
MLTLAMLLALVGLLLGYMLKDFTWFARFGALVVAVGITLLARASVIHEDIIAHVLEVETGLSHLNPEHVIDTLLGMNTTISRKRFTRH